MGAAGDRMSYTVSAVAWGREQRVRTWPGQAHGPGAPQPRAALSPALREFQAETMTQGDFPAAQALFR